MTSLHLLDGVVGIYMPDFKLWDSQQSLRYLKAKDSAEVAWRVVQEMHRQVGILRFNEDGLARRGILARHLVTPGMIDQTGEIFRFLAEGVASDTYVNMVS